MMMAMMMLMMMMMMMMMMIRFIGCTGSLLLIAAQTLNLCADSVSPSARLPIADSSQRTSNKTLRMVGVLEFISHYAEARRGKPSDRSALRVSMPSSALLVPTSDRTPACSRRSRGPRTE